MSIFGTLALVVGIAILLIFLFYAFAGIFSFPFFLIGFVFKIIFFPLNLISQYIYPVGTLPYLIVIGVLFFLFVKLFMTYSKWAVSFKGH